MKYNFYFINFLSYISLQKRLITKRIASIKKIKSHDKNYYNTIDTITLDFDLEKIFD